MYCFLRGPDRQADVEVLDHKFTHVTTFFCFALLRRFDRRGLYISSTGIQIPNTLPCYYLREDRQADFKVSNSPFIVWYTTFFYFNLLSPKKGLRHRIAERKENKVRFEILFLLYFCEKIRENVFEDVGSFFHILLNDFPVLF